MLNKKPLIRWTIGPCSDNGFYCLSQSIRNIKRIYGKYFKYAIFYNNLNKNQIKLLPKVDYILNQNKYANFNGWQPAWKLYPARINNDSHEIILDNDVIIYDEPPLFKLFLKEKKTILITEAFKRSYNGILEKLIPLGFNVNSGVICLPPNFDFEFKIKETIKSFNLKFENHFDEQTLISYIFSKEENLKIINIKDISVHTENCPKGKFGIHFVGINKLNSFKNTTIYYKNYCKL